MRVGYLGPEGTHSQEAIAACALLADANDQPFPTLGAIYDGVEAGRLDYGILPLENSLGGSVGTTLDLLWARRRLQIKREVPVIIRHHLLVGPGGEQGKVGQVLSHPQALAQCEPFLHQHLPSARLVPTASTAEAARLVKTRPGTAAIASEAAAAHYGLVTLVSDVQGDAHNTTRFVVLAAGDEAPTGHDRTSIAFCLERDQPGGLHRVLGELASRDLNLSRIESRPSKAALGLYVFFLDFEGHRRDRAAADALAKLPDVTQDLVVLGSYPRAS